MNNNTNFNSTLLGNIYNNLIDYVSVIQKQEGNKTNWTKEFIAECRQGNRDFAFIYKSLKEGLITQFGFEMTNEIILPEIMWSSDLVEFCD